MATRELRRDVFLGGFRWADEDPDHYRRMTDVLKRAMEDPAVRGRVGKCFRSEVVPS